MSYPTLVPGLDIRPNLGWAHDVKGYSPADGSAFNEGSRSISLGVDLSLASQYWASLAYTDYLDGDYGTRGDRDYVAFSVGANF